MSSPTSQSVGMNGSTSLQSGHRTLANGRNRYANAVSFGFQSWLFGTNGYQVTISASNRFTAAPSWSPIVGVLMPSGGEIRWFQNDFDSANHSRYTVSPYHSTGSPS